MIADGIGTGEFQVSDTYLAAVCTCTAIIRFFHPQLIAECADKPSPTLDQMVDFVVGGLQTQAALSRSSLDSGPVPVMYSLGRSAIQPRR